MSQRVVPFLTLLFVLLGADSNPGQEPVPTSEQLALKAELQRLDGAKVVIDRAEAQQLVARLEKNVRTPGELTAVMAPRVPTILRQVLYGKVRELWLYDHPLSLCAVVDFPKGEDPRIHSFRWHA